jgi:hypothetical protein
MERYYADFPDGELTQNAHTRYARESMDLDQERNPDNTPKQPGEQTASPQHVEEPVEQAGRSPSAESASVDGEQTSPPGEKTEAITGEPDEEKVAPEEQSGSDAVKAQALGGRGGGKGGGVERPEARLKQLEKDLDKAKTEDELRAEVAKGAVEKFINSMLRIDPEARDTYMARLEATLESKELSFEQKKAGVIGILNNTHQERKHAREGHRLPGSIEEVASSIMDADPVRWGEDSPNALIDKEGRFNKVNFMKWVRDRMMFHHDFTPDAEIPLFNLINIQTDYRTITLNDMLNDKERYFKSILTTPGKVDVLGDLYDQMLFEVWLFQTSRNNNVKYRMAMGSDKSLPETLEGMYRDNVFTKEGTFIWGLTLPTLGKMEQNGDFKKEQSSGQAMREGLMIYYYLSDPEMLKRIAGEKWDETQLFSNVNFMKNEDGKKSKYPPVRPELFDDKTGKLKPDQMEAYMKHFNIFNDQQKNPQAVSETRHRIRQFLRSKYGLEEEEALYVEEWSHSFTRWTGIGARNDTDGIGFDAWSKVMNTKEYRKRQVGYSAVSGDKNTLFGLKRLGVDFWVGNRVLEKGPNGPELGRTLLEVLMGDDGKGSALKEEAIDLSKKDPLKKEDLLFEVDTMRKFAENHITNSFNVYQQVIAGHGLHLDGLVTVDQFGRVVVDLAGADKIFGGILKALRYAYRGSTAKVPMDHKVRYWEKNEAGKVVPKESTVAEMLFDREVLSMMGENVDVLDKDREKMNAKEKKDFGEVTSEVNKKVFMYLVATEMYKHRDPSQTGKLFSFAEYQKVYRFLEGMIGDVSGHEGDMTSVHAKTPYFKKKELDRIRKISKTEFGRLFGTELAAGLTVGTGSGIKEAVEEAWKYVIS